MRLNLVDAGAVALLTIRRMRNHDAFRGGALPAANVHPWVDAINGQCGALETDMDRLPAAREFVRFHDSLRYLKTAGRDRLVLAQYCSITAKIRPEDLLVTMAAGVTAGLFARVPPVAQRTRRA